MTTRGDITKVTLDREPPALGPFDRERAEAAGGEVLTGTLRAARRA